MLEQVSIVEREARVSEQTKDWQQRTPHFLSEFITEFCPHAHTEKWQQGSEFIKRHIRCTCGSQGFFLKASIRFRTHGFFRRKPLVEYDAPYFWVCTQCIFSRLLFDPDRHGWDGQDPDAERSTTDESELMVESEAKQFMVCYSYQGEANYDDLIAEGISNPEDFFDTFSLYARPLSESEQRWCCVNAFECA